MRQQFETIGQLLIARGMPKMILLPRRAGD
jgi:hypothetical protein